AIIFGFGFVTVKIGFNSGFSPSLLTMLRMCIACAVLFPFFYKSIIKTTKSELKHGLIAGIFLITGFLLQAIGVQLTVISNSAFLTTTNVIMVPFISWMILKKHPKIAVFFSIALGFAGIAILTRAFDANIHFNLGDILCLLSAVCFALQISYTEYAAKKVNTSSFLFVELAAGAVISALFFFITDSKSLGQITNLPAGLLSSLWLGAACTGFAFWAQTISQKVISSSSTVLILSMQAVFASLFSVLLGFENFQYTLALGGGIIMLSIILLELSNRIGSKKKLPLQKP
ncbi:MAG: DMT family transporter, partial [Eubacteriales bacterium]